MTTSTDSRGNSYVSGYTTSASLGTQLGSHGAADSFISKHDSNGNLLWLKQIGGGGSTNTTVGFNGIHVDSSGNIFVHGDTSSSSLGRQFGTYGITYDYFLSKWDSNGNLQ